MIRLILTLILAVAISAAVLLFGVLWGSDGHRLRRSHP